MISTLPGKPSSSWWLGEGGKWSLGIQIWRSINIKYCRLLPSCQHITAVSETNCNSRLPSHSTFRHHTHPPSPQKTLCKTTASVNLYIDMESCPWYSICELGIKLGYMTTSTLWAHFMWIVVHTCLQMYRKIHPLIRVISGRIWGRVGKRLITEGSLPCIYIFLYCFSFVLQPACFYNLKKPINIFTY